MATIQNIPTKDEKKILDPIGGRTLETGTGQAIATGQGAEGQGLGPMAQLRPPTKKLGDETGVGITVSHSTHFLSLSPDAPIQINPNRSIMTPSIHKIILKGCAINFSIQHILHPQPNYPPKAIPHYHYKSLLAIGL